MYRKKTVYIGFGTYVSEVSDIHWESWDVSPKDKGGLLYRQHLTSQTELYFIDHAAHMHVGTREHPSTLLQNAFLFAESLPSHRSFVLSINIEDQL